MNDAARGIIKYVGQEASAALNESGAGRLSAGRARQDNLPTLRWRGERDASLRKWHTYNVCRQQPEPVHGGRRIEKALNGVLAVRYSYEGDRVIEDRDDADGVSATYVFGNGADEILIKEIEVFES